MSRVHRVGVIAGPKVAASSDGQQMFTASGTFVVPAGVTSICVVAIGRGATAFNEEPYVYGGGGGALAYGNSLTVSPGETLNVEISTARSALLRSAALLCSARAASARGGATVEAGTGYEGGTGSYNNLGLVANGGGAGGYTSIGGFLGFGGSGNGGGGSSSLGGGAGGASGGAPTPAGGSYGGGGGAQYGTLGAGGPGCVRIIWGAGRAFPNTNTGDV